MITADIVSRFPGFSALPLADRQRLAVHALRRRVPKGEVLFREGDPATCLVLVEHGLLKILKHGPAERSTLVEIARPSAVLGRASLYDHGRHHVTALALTEVVVVQLAADDAVSVLSSSPEAMIALLGALSEDVRRLTERVADLGEAGVERRLGQALCRLCGIDCNVTPPQTGEPVEIPVPLSRQDLADMVGTSVETAIRVLSKWSRQGVVRTTRDGLQVQSCQALRAVVTAPPRLQKSA